VKVFDLRGRLVLERTKGGQAGIDDDIVWNAADIPTGVYIVRVTGSGMQHSVRMAVVR